MERKVLESNPRFIKFIETLRLLPNDLMLLLLCRVYGIGSNDMSFLHESTEEKKLI
jgi:predicted nucleic acid-binding protein